MKKYVFLSICFLVFATAVEALIPAGLVTFVVKNEKGQLLSGVKVVLHSEKITTYEEKLVTNEKGSAKILLKLATYDVKFTKDGYAPFTKKVKPLLGDRKTIEITLKTVEKVIHDMDKKGKLTGKAKAITLYNSLVPLLKEGKDADVLPKLKQILQLDPELAPALFHTGRIELRENDLDGAEKNLLKAIQIDPKIKPAYAMLAELYKRKGDTENYQKFLKQAEDMGAVSAGEYYNQAADAINAGDDAKAKPLLLKAIAVNPKFADSYYQLGMCYMRGGDYAKSIENLQKYLKIEPNGKHAAECKQFISALQSMLKK